MSSCIFAPTRPLGGVNSTRRAGRSQRLLARADKEAALKQLRDSQAGTAARLAGVEAELKRASTVASAASSSADTQVRTSAPLEGGLEEIDQFNYYDKINGASTPLVVVDFFTEWCGPCKLIYPRLVEMQKEMAGQVTFYKFNCNKKNKELGVQLGIKVAPTFFIYKAGEKAASMTGAKVEDLRALIAENM